MEAGNCPPSDGVQNGKQNPSFDVPVLGSGLSVSSGFGLDVFSTLAQNPRAKCVFFIILFIIFPT